MPAVSAMRPLKVFGSNSTLSRSEPRRDLANMMLQAAKPWLEKVQYPGLESRRVLGKSKYGSKAGIDADKTDNPLIASRNSAQGNAKA